METSKYTDITKIDVDYRKLDKSALHSLSKLLSDILTKYGCTHARWQEFIVSDASNRIRADFDEFDAYFDNSSTYDDYSLLISGKTPDKSAQLDIVVGVDFKYSEPNCHITIISEGITPAQQTDIVDCIDKFIYEAAKVELPEQPSDSTAENEATERVEKDNSTNTEERIPFKQRLTNFFHLVGGAKSLIELAKLIWNFFS